jgi:hypothetical protein
MFALWWDAKVPDLCYQSNDTRILVILEADIVLVDDDFLTNLISKFPVFPIRYKIKELWKSHMPNIY